MLSADELINRKIEEDLQVSFVESDKTQCQMNADYSELSDLMFFVDFRQNHLEEESSESQVFTTL